MLQYKKRLARSVVNNCLEPASKGCALVEEIIKNTESTVITTSPTDSAAEVVDKVGVLSGRGAFNRH